MGLNIALDTNIFIYAYQRNDTLGEKARKLLNELQQDKNQLSISVIVFEEFLVMVYKQKLEKNLTSYEDFLTSGGSTMVIDFDRQIARTAAKLRAEHPSLRAPDAIHLASAIESKAKIFITTDRRLPKKIGKLEIRVMSLTT